ncbi:sugar phosphate nucleotidyltransferase, partial [Pelagibacteraceae bacterium]|nr:sugar phosphate nucleotidyltransferase [Pelagibacteraceae bacterium]
MKIKPIILSGGSGVRLWPISRKNMPKQFVDLFSSGTNLFEQTLIRVKDSTYAEPIIISNKEQRFDVLNNVKKNKVKIDKMILEDTPKNTAPAFAVASNVCEENDILCFLPSDHYIKNTKSFLSAIKNAAKLADQGQLVILGLNST